MNIRFAFAGIRAPRWLVLSFRSTSASASFWKISKLGRAGSIPFETIRVAVKQALAARSSSKR